MKNANEMADGGHTTALESSADAAGEWAVDAAMAMASNPGEAAAVARAGDMVRVETLSAEIIRAGGGWMKFETSFGTVSRYFTTGCHKDGAWGWRCIEVSASKDGMYGWG